ncbi:HEPN domain-containing protein [Geobacter grbiciae]|uniref:HEPN domain-containing protein n=1 Tax=Geobacter grbiciae TaxID=155042 RepID=UPI001C02C21F|nr:HEPN domain-containing protein [Geobacter grbiciae]MBT1076163.1 HEPN domain-containing protein [Geobacter grbiciae]
MINSVRELLDKSAQSIGAAETLMREQYVDFAAGRAYYAMFYAIEALLLSRDMSFSKHSAVIAAFGKEFVKAGTFDSRFHRYLLNAFDLRNAGDYGIIHSVSEEKARQTIEEAKELLAVVTNYLSDE